MKTLKDVRADIDPHEPRPLPPVDKYERLGEQVAARELQKVANPEYYADSE